MPPNQSSNQIVGGQSLASGGAQIFTSGGGSYTVKNLTPSQKKYISRGGGSSAKLAQVAQEDTKAAEEAARKEAEVQRVNAQRAAQVNQQNMSRTTTGQLMSKKPSAAQQFSTPLKQYTPYVPPGTNRQRSLTQTEFQNIVAEQQLRKSLQGKAQRLQGLTPQEIAATPGVSGMSTREGTQFFLEPTPQEVSSAVRYANVKFREQPAREQAKSLLTEGAVAVTRGLGDASKFEAAAGLGPLAFAFGGVIEKSPEAFADRQIGVTGNVIRVATGIGASAATSGALFKAVEPNLFEARAIAGLQNQPSRTLATEIVRNKKTGESTFLVTSSRQGAAVEQNVLMVVKGKRGGGSRIVSGQSGVRYKDPSTGKVSSSVDFFTGGTTPTRTVTGARAVSGARAPARRSSGKLFDDGQGAVRSVSFADDTQGNFGRGFIDQPGVPIRKFPVSSVSKQSGRTINELNLKLDSAQGLESGGAVLRGRPSGKTTIRLLDEDVGGGPSSSSSESGFTSFSRGSGTGSRAMRTLQQTDSPLFGVTQLVKQAPVPSVQTSSSGATQILSGAGAEAKMLGQTSLFSGTGQYERTPNLTGVAPPKRPSTVFENLDNPRSPQVTRLFGELSNQQPKQKTRTSSAALSTPIQSAGNPQAFGNDLGLSPAQTNRQRSATAQAPLLSTNQTTRNPLFTTFGFPGFSTNPGGRLAPRFDLDLGVSRGGSFRGGAVEIGLTPSFTAISLGITGSSRGLKAGSPFLGLALRPVGGSSRPRRKSRRTKRKRK